MIWFCLSLAFAQDPWLTADGAGPYLWGSTTLPSDAVPRRKDFFLPDSGFLGSPPPNDLQIPGPTGEQRILRYVNGALVDAWWISNTPIDPGPVVGYQKPTWSGMVLGPAEDGFRAYGRASSWDLSDRTFFYWHDQLGKLDILAARAVPPPQYGIRRPTPLEVPTETGSHATITGDFNQLIKDSKGRIASCFDQADMPVDAHVTLKLDHSGLPARLKVDAGQPSLNVEECLAGALLTIRGAPDFMGEIQIKRLR